MKVPTRVTHDITLNEVVTTIYSGKAVMAKLVNKRTSFGFSRKTHEIERQFPEFMAEAEDFHGTTVADHLRLFEDETHSDLDQP